MHELQQVLGWLTRHEPLLSALAALVVIGGVILSPLGRGLRTLFKGSGDGAGRAGPSKRALPARDRPSIAVLPFANMSDDRDQAFLADGMTQDVIAGLSCDPRLFVIARNSTFRYKDQSADVREVGRDLGVRFVVEGSVRRVGDNLRVTAQLIDARDGAHLFSEVLDRPFADMFQIQDEITASVVAALTAHLKHTVTPEVRRARPESLEAWELFQRAATHLYPALDAQGRREAESLLRKAVRKDPGYAVAWVLLASTIAVRWLMEPGTDSPGERREAEHCVRQGARLAPSDPDVLAYQGEYLTNAGRAAEALPFLEQARRLNPNDVHYRMQLGRALLYAGRPAEAMDELETLLRLNPHDPTEPFVTALIASCLFALGRYAESEVRARRSLAAHGPSRADLILSLALAAQGKIEAAREAMRQAFADNPAMNAGSNEAVFRSLGWDEKLVPEVMKYARLARPPELPTLKA